MKISNSQQRQVGPFLLTSISLYNHYENEDNYIESFVVENPTIVIIRKGTLFTKVDGVKYAEGEGVLRYLEPGKSVYFEIAPKEVGELYGSHASFVLISIKEKQKIDYDSDLTRLAGTVVEELKRKGMSESELNKIGFCS